MEFGRSLSTSPVWARLRANSVPIQRRVSTLTAVTFVALSGWTLGQVVWLVYPNNTPTVAQWQPPAVSSSASTSTSNGLNIAPLKAANLFGQYQERQAPVVKKPVVVQEAPETRLNLVLVGAVSSSAAEKGLAVIANRGKQATYGIGEVVDGTRASLKAVFVDRVIIDNQGRDETLMLEGVDYSKTPTSIAQRNDSASSAPALSDEQISQARAEIAANPQAIFQYVRLSPVKKDQQVIGYRVSPGKNASLFDGVGLKNGDIAVQINGSDLNDPAAMTGIFKSITEQNELNLTVERDGQQHDIYIQF
nr:type II secretion system protein GspC [Vibrio agarilyticus]